MCRTEVGLSRWGCGQKPGLSTRHVERLVLRLRTDGTPGLVCLSRGRPGNHQLKPGVAALALSLLRERSADFGPSFASEKLAERHGLVIGKDTVRRLMIDAGLWVPRRHLAYTGQICPLEHE